GLLGPTDRRGDARGGDRSARRWQEGPEVLQEGLRTTRPPRWSTQVGGTGGAGESPQDRARRPTPRPRCVGHLQVLRTAACARRLATEIRGPGTANDKRAHPNSRSTVRGGA